MKRETYAVHWFANGKCDHATYPANTELQKAIHGSTEKLKIFGQSWEGDELKGILLACPNIEIKDLLFSKAPHLEKDHGY